MLRPERRGGARGAWPIRRWCWCCRAAARGEIRRLAACSARRWRWWRERVGAARGRAADGAASRRRGARGDSRLAGAAAHRDRAGGERSGVPPGARGARHVRHGRRSNSRLPACRWSPPISVAAVRGADRPPAGQRRQASILANLVLGENVGAGAAAAGLHAGAARRRRCVPLLADTPERRRQIEAFARLDAIMEIGRGAERPRRAPRSWIAPAPSANRQRETVASGPPTA